MNAMHHLNKLAATKHHRCGDCAHFQAFMTDADYGFCPVMGTHVYKKTEMACFELLNDLESNRPVTIMNDGDADDIVNTNTVVVYGDVKGDVTNCETVVIINGDVKGDVINCANATGLLADDDSMKNFKKILKQEMKKM